MLERLITFFESLGFKEMQRNRYKGQIRVSLHTIDCYVNLSFNESTASGKASLTYRDELGPVLDLTFSDSEILSAVYPYDRTFTYILLLKLMAYELPNHIAPLIEE